jgi:hypothetical protein
MQLRTARLCLDCEEVHESQQCPLCASETFVFMTRWVPVPERRQKPRSTLPPPSPESPEALDSYRELLATGKGESGSGWQFVKRGAVGLALFGVAGWVWRRNREQPGPLDAGHEPPATDDEM